MIIPIVLLSLLYFATIFFGGAHLWVQTLLILSLFFFSLAILWQQTFKKSQSHPLQVPVIRDPVFWIGLLFLLWTVLSLIPLPSDLLRVISPKAFDIWNGTRSVGGEYPHPLSLYPYMTVNSWIFGLFLLAFYQLALRGIHSHRQIHWLVVGLMGLGTLESLYALGQVATARPYVLWWLKDVSQEVATGSFIYRNHFACFLAMIICLGVGYLWALGKEHQGKNFPNKQALVYRAGVQMGSLGVRGIIILLILAVMIAALLVTASRGGVLTLLAGLIIMGLLLATRFFKSQKTVILLLALSLICTYVGFVALDRVLERFQSFELGFEDRMALAQETFQIGRDFPVSGSGLGTFEFVYPAYQARHLEALGDYAHNDWVQLFAETGSIGLLILGGGFLWFMGRSIALWRKRRDPFKVGLGLGGLGAMVTVSLHSLSDFNLHLPANALLLALITALTWSVLNSPGPEGREKAPPARAVLKVPLWAAIPFLTLLTFFLGALSLRTFQVWQADTLARTVWNSTLPFKEPTDSDLLKAWTLAPGNARYWGWLASRVTEKPALAGQVEHRIPKGIGDLNLYLLGQGIVRNPTAWNIWRDFAWAAFFKASKEPKTYLPLAEQASLQASRFRPYAFSGHLDSGMIGLASYARQGGKGEKKLWMEAFNRALSLNPDLSPRVADQVLLYLGPEGAKELMGLLPKETKSYLLTGVHLLKQGIYKEGLEYLRQGEHYREREIERLWEEALPARVGSLEKRKNILEQLRTLDPQYPGLLLTQGSVLEALKSQDRRHGVLGELWDRKELAWNLKLLEEQKQGSFTEIAYFLGRMAEEEKDLKNARFQFHRALQHNPQFFPAWVRLEKVLKQTLRSEGDRVELENLQKKLGLYEMDRVVGDAWVPEGVFKGSPAWKAPFRNRNRLSRLEIDFSGESSGAWKLILDGRFVSAWAGNRYTGEKKMMIPEGEHEFKLIHFKESNKIKSEKLPFRLAIRFD